MQRDFIKKIRIMAALSVYDKYDGEKDRKLDGNFKRDYIYKKNCWSRICVTFGFLILAGFYMLYTIFVNDISLETLDFIVHAKRLGIVWIILMVIYTVIGSYVYGKQYDKAQKRLNSYYSLLKKLNDYQTEENTQERN